MQIIVALFFAIILTWLLYKCNLYKKLRFKPIQFCLLFVLKLVFGVFFYLVYTVYYTDSQTSDMHKYYNDAVKIFDLTKSKPLSYLSILSGIEMNEQDEAITQQLNFWYQEESASVINDSRMVIRFNLMMMPFSRGNIYIHLVMMVFLSFIGLSLLYLSLEKYFEQKEFWLLISCFGLPSVMFWSSGIMKEGILIFFLGIFIYALFDSKMFSFKSFLLFFLSLAGMFFAKFYVALSFIPSILFLVVCHYRKTKTPISNLIISLVLVIIIGIGFNSFMDNLPLEKLSKKQNDFINLSLGGVYLRNITVPFDTIFTLNKSSIRMLEAHHQIVEGKIVQLKDGSIYHHWKNPGYADTLISQNNQSSYKILKILQPTGSAITLKRLMPNYKSIIYLFPEAFVNVFFRPFIFDVENMFSLLACIENTIIVFLILVLFFIYKNPNKENFKLILFSILFVFTLYSLVGLTTPVLGAAVRYKVPALPFLMISIFLFYDYKRLGASFKKYLAIAPIKKVSNTNSKL
jgi:hypothetical protein